MREFPIFHVTFSDNRSLATAFGRFQESYENPVFKDRIFTWDDLGVWWSAQPDGATPYVEYWNGFNVPSATFAPFRDGRFDPLTAEEKTLLTLLGKLPKDGYVIGTVEGDWSLLTHELVHALYATVPAYRDSVDALVKGRKLKRMRAELRRMGYAEGVLDDEANAYLTAGPEGPQMLGREERLLGPKLRELLRERFGWDPGNLLNPRLFAFLSRIHVLTYPSS